MVIKRGVSFLSNEKFTEDILKVNKVVQIALFKKINFLKKNQSAKSVLSKNRSSICEEFSNSKT